MKMADPTGGRDLAPSHNTTSARELGPNPNYRNFGEHLDLPPFPAKGVAGEIFLDAKEKERQERVARGEEVSENILASALKEGGLAPSDEELLSLLKLNFPNDQEERLRKDINFLKKRHPELYPKDTEILKAKRNVVESEGPLKDLAAKLAEAGISVPKRSETLSSTVKELKGSFTEDDLIGEMRKIYPNYDVSMLDEDLTKIDPLMFKTISGMEIENYDPNVLRKEIASTRTIPELISFLEKFGAIKLEKKTIHAEELVVILKNIASLLKKGEKLSFDEEKRVHELLQDLPTDLGIQNQAARIAAGKIESPLPAQVVIHKEQKTTKIDQGAEAERLGIEALKARLKKYGRKTFLDLNVAQGSKGRIKKGAGNEVRPLRGEEAVAPATETRNEIPEQEEGMPAVIRRRREAVPPALEGNQATGVSENRERETTLDKVYAALGKVNNETEALEALFKKGQEGMAWAREKYFDLVKEYQKLPFKNKIALSVGLGGAALVGAASGAVVLAGAAGAMSLTLRTLGTGATYMGLKTALERDYAKKEGEGEVISDNRKRLMLAASAVLAGLTGTAVAYAMETTGATDKIHEVVGKAGSALKGAFTHDVAPPVLHQETIGETLAKLRSSGALVEGADIDDGLGAGAPAPSYEVQKGDSLWSSVKHLLNDESKLSGLSVEEQNRVISKYISVIAEDPEKYGVTSGNPDIIRAGDHITLGGLGDEDLPEKITNWNDWKTDASPEMETPELESDGPSAQRELEEIQNMSQAPSAKVGTVIPPTEPSHSNGVSEETIQSFKAYAPQNESLIDQTKVPNAASESLEPKLGAVVEELKPAHIDLTDKQLFKELRGDSGFKKLIDSYFAPKSFGIFGTPIGEGLKSAPFHFIEIHPDMKLGEIETLAKNNNVQDIKTAWETLEKMAKETGVVLKGDKGVSTFLAEVLEKKK